MKNRTKLISIPLVFAFICLLVTLVTGLLAILMEDKLLYIILSISFALVAFVLFIVHLIKQRKHFKNLNKDKEDIIKALENVAKDENTSLLNVSNQDKQLSDIARKINNIYLHKAALLPNRIYKGNNFLYEIGRFIRRGEINDFIYLRVTNIDKKLYDHLFGQYENKYSHLGKDYIDILIPNPDDKDEFIKAMNLAINENKDLRIYIGLSSQHSLDDIVKFCNERYLIAQPRLQIYEKEEKSFRSISDKYASMDLAKEGILNEYLKEIYDYLPFSHIGIKVNNGFYRLCTLGKLSQLDKIDKEEFSYYKEEDLFTFKGDQLSLVLASDITIMLEKEDEDNIDEFKRMIRLLLVHELERDEYEGLQHRYMRLEELSHNLSYEINDDYIITFASRRLLETFNNNLIGRPCYEALYGRKEPCKNCPMVKEYGRNSFLVGSDLFKSRHIPHDDKDTIYLLNEEKPYVPNKQELSTKLLNLINNNSKGYLIAFKIDSLEDMALKNKTDIEVVVKEIIETFRIYGIFDNLYRKDVDEFVYILEEASVAECINIAKQVSKAFLEKFPSEKADISFVPKVIMLSYPLEVNTLFSLESLCRSMFSSISDKGRLHRLGEDPVPIDNHRYYIEILEQSYKDNDIPLTYHDVKDLKEHHYLSYVELNYFDGQGKHIPEDEITLYTKIDKTYTTLLEKVIKALDFEEDYRTFVIPIGKEGLDLKAASSIASYIRSIKADFSRFILELKEKDAYNYREIVQKMMEMGFNFAIVIKDNLIYKLDVLQYRYLKIDGNKLQKDQLYQYKVNGVLNHDVSLMMEKQYEGLLDNLKYLCE